jgi:hypothetical protein
LTFCEELHPHNSPHRRTIQLVILVQLHVVWFMILRFCLALCLTVPTEAVPSLVRQGRSEPPSIEWSKERNLRWQDFMMRPPAWSSDDSHSWVALDISWTCGAEFVFKVTTTFDPSRSWVRPGSQEDALLRHEQTHFDLTELAARQLRKHLAGLNNPCSTSTTMREIDRVIANQRQAWEQEQKRYDRDTRHGSDQTRQEFWGLRTQRQLDQFKQFE